MHRKLYSVVAAFQCVLIFVTAFIGALMEGSGMAVEFHVGVGVGVVVGVGVDVDKDLSGRRNLLTSQLMNLTRNWIPIMQKPCKLSYTELWKVAGTNQ